MDVLSKIASTATTPAKIFCSFKGMPNFSYVSKILGKMIHVDSVGFDLENKRDLTNFWSGWLPTEEITQLIQL